jgi:hypothetical protein
VTGHWSRVDPAPAREEASHILSDRRYHHDPAPRPLRGALEWLGDRFRTVGTWLRDAFRAVPGPTWAAIGLAVLVVVGVIGWWLVRTRATTGARSFGAARGIGGSEREDPDRLERDADIAERAGDFDHALRLRFRAGLLRLDRNGVIRYRPSLTTGEVRRLLGSESFDDLAARFEEVAYGLDPASPEDVAAARENWPHVVERATRR